VPRRFIVQAQDCYSW